MAQHDYNIANASFPTVRTDINNVLSAINTCNSGSSRPSGAVAGTIWLNTAGGATAHILTFYDGTNDITLGTINTTANTVDWSDSSIDTVTFKEGGTNFTRSLLVGHATTGTLNAATDNTGVGSSTTLTSLTSGDNNSALGSYAGQGITTGSSNTTIGAYAGYRISGAGENTVVGQSALAGICADTNSGYNTVMGSNAMNVASGAQFNVAIGRDAGREVTTGDSNIFIGYNAGANDATAGITTGSGNVIIGRVDPASRTDNRQLKIAGNDGSTTTTWITGDNSGNVTVAGTLTSSTGLTKTVGKETMWIPASAMYGATTNPADAQQVETTAVRPDMKVLDFDASTDEFAQFSVAFPKSWNEGTVTYQVYWSPASTNTGDCIFGLQGVSCGDNDTIDVAYGTAINVTDAGIGTVEDQQVSSESSAVTIAGSPAVDQLTYFQFFRDANAGGDTFSADARVLGIKIFFTTDASNDV